MRLIKTISAITLFIALVVSCEKNKCFHSVGEQSSKIIYTDSFNFINLYGIADMELVQDTTYYIEAFGGSNVIENLEAETIADSVELYNYNSCFWLRDYERPLLKVHFKDINRINLHEASYVYSTDTIRDAFQLTIRCNIAEADLKINNASFALIPYGTTGGNYKVAGKTDYLYSYCFYTAICDASELQCKEARIYQKGTCDYKLWCTEKLWVQILNRGNVLLKGNPEIIIDSLASTGELINIED
ncbi:MAG: DUF2807 domain-containing protein [Bacteroidales bacterium]|nr:DUF2807 domain-containing protein [Bacteroidales bacterium]MBN2819609.1 DUF2807 domain-containing protein [Bacteroidales bacterium]